MLRVQLLITHTVTFCTGAFLALMNPFFKLPAFPLTLLGITYDQGLSQAMTSLGRILDLE